MAGKIWLTYEFSPAMLTRPDMVLHWKKLESCAVAAELAQAGRKAGTLVTAVRKEDVAKNFERWLGFPVPAVSVQIKFAPGDVVLLGKIYGWNTIQHHRGQENVQWFLVIVHDKTFAPPAKSDLDALKLAPDQLDKLRQRGLFESFRTEIQEGQVLRHETSRLEGALRDIEQLADRGAPLEEIKTHARRAIATRARVGGMRPFAWLTAESPERIALNYFLARDENGELLHTFEEAEAYAISLLGDGSIKPTNERPKALKEGSL